MKMWNFLFFTRLLLISQLSLIAHVQAAELVVTVKKAPAECAPLMVAVFNSEASFMRQGFRYGEDEVARGARVVFKNIPYGRYAVSAYCDNNRNGKLDRGVYSKPIEPVGISRNPMMRTKPPQFDDASFVIDVDEYHIRLNLQ